MKRMINLLSISENFSLSRSFVSNCFAGIFQAHIKLCCIITSEIKSDIVRFMNQICHFTIIFFLRFDILFADMLGFSVDLIPFLTNPFQGLRDCHSISIFIYTIHILLQDIVDQNPPLPIESSLSGPSNQSQISSLFPRI